MWHLCGFVTNRGGGWIIGTHMWYLCGFVTNRGGGNWIIGTLMWHLCRFVTNRGERVDYRNTNVAFMWVCY